MEVRIDKLTDLEKLVGWTIRKLEILPDRTLGLTISHPLAEKSLQIVIRPLVNLELSNIQIGNGVPIIVNPGLNFNIQEVNVS